MSIVNVAAIPMDVLEDDVLRNIENAVTAIRSLDECVDLAVLPEFFTAPFTDDRSVMDRHAHESAVVPEMLGALAMERGMAIAGSYLAADGSMLRNRGFVVTADGAFNTYDKHHLFGIGGEPGIVSAGIKKSLPVDIGKCRVQLCICYDLRFPAWNRNSIDRLYDILIVPSNWPTVRSYAWRTLLAARAIENQCYVVGCDRTGADGYGDYSIDDSCILSYSGKPVGEFENGVITASLDIDSLHDVRRKIPFLKDADKIDCIG